LVHRFHVTILEPLGYTPLNWCSIDNDDSRDLDQLAVAEVMPDGAAKVLVAVADVDSVVKKQSALDDHARKNTTSVYTVAETFSMLPEKLSTDLTSLNHESDGLAVVIEMVFAGDGSLQSSDVSVFDGDEIKDLEADKKNRAREIIEDFMIAANGVSAQYLTSKGFPSLRRVVRVPKRWDRIVELAAERGSTLPEEPDAKALERFLVAAKAADPLRFPDLSLSVIKLMGAGEYIAESSGERVLPGTLVLRSKTMLTPPPRTADTPISLRSDC